LGIIFENLFFILENQQILLQGSLSVWMDDVARKFG